MSVWGVVPDDVFPFPEGVSNSIERKIVSAEYFIETDPGEGKGESIDAEDLMFDQTTEQLKELSLNLDSLPGGERRVGVRVKDNLGDWSTTSFVDVYVTDLTSVEVDAIADSQVYRIMIDNLPAVGSNVSVDLNGTTYTYKVKTGDDLNAVRNGLLASLNGNSIASVTLLPGGVLELRGKQMESSYSVSSSEVLVQAHGRGAIFPDGTDELLGKRILAAEYFIETDPGEGKGESIDAEDLMFDQATEQLKQLSLNLDSLPGGERRVGVRVKDNLGVWSTTSFVDVFITDLTTVEADGSGSTQSDRVIIDNLPAAGSIISVKVGPKKFAYQVKSGDDLFKVREGLAGALSGSPIVYVENHSNGYIILEGRKNDHHYDVVAINGLSVQRVSFADLKFPQGIESSLPVQITNAEYFIDSDPGEGKGFEVDAEDLAFDSSTEGIKNLSLEIDDLSAGNRRLGLRFRNGDGNWSEVRYLEFEAEDAGDYIPSRVKVNPRSIDENLTPGVWKGTLSTIDWNDPTGSGSYTYELLNDIPNDNSSFSISGNEITAKRVFNYEIENIISLRIRTTDDTGRSVITNLTLKVNDDEQEDSDQDGLTQSQEEQLGTSDNQSDSDSDGFSDYDEVLAGSDPLFGRSVPGLAPKDLRLAPDIVLENQPVGSMVSRLITEDEDDPQGRDVYTYVLDQGVKSFQNDYFSIEQNGSLTLLKPLDYEQLSTLTVAVKVFDSTGLSLSKLLVLSVADDKLEDFDGDGLNQFAEEQLGTVDTKADSDADGFSDFAEVNAGTDPTDYYSSPNLAPLKLRALDTLEIFENKLIGSVVGQFTADDPENHSLNFSLVSGYGNDLFSIDSNGTLKTLAVFDYEKNATSYSLKVIVRDQYGASLLSDFTVSITNEIEDHDGDGVENHEDNDDDGDGFSDLEETAYGSDPLDSKSVANKKPAFLTTENTFTVHENQPVGTPVVHFEVSDPDKDAFSFSVIKGSSHFMLDNSGILKSKQIFDYENGPRQFQVLIRATDEHGAAAEKDISISILDDSSDNVMQPSHPTIPNDQFSKLNVETLDGRMESGAFWLEAKVSAHSSRGQLGFTLLSFTNQVRDFFYNGELSEELIFQMKLNHSKYTHFAYYRAFIEVDGIRIFGAFKKLNLIQSNFELGPFENQIGANGWIESQWFGVFKPVSDQWLYHTRLGWVYFSPTDIKSFWFWKESHGWLWTEEDLWPFMWSHASNGWLYLIGDERIIFYNYERQIWESSEE